MSKKMIFSSIETIVGSTLSLIIRNLIRQVTIKILVENSVFAIQHIGNRKGFTEVIPQRPNYSFSIQF